MENCPRVRECVCQTLVLLNMNKHISTVDEGTTLALCNQQYTQYKHCHLLSTILS